MKIILFAVLMLTLIACKNTQQLNLDNVQNIRLDSPAGTSVNYNTPFDASVVLTLIKGEPVTLETTKHFSSSANISIDLTAKRATLVTRPSSFDQTYELISLTLTDRNEEFVSFNDTVFLNFSNGINIGEHLSAGLGGETGKTHGNSLFFRDGKDGDLGGIGGIGQNADSLEIRIWSSNLSFFIHVTNISKNWIAKYRLNTLNTINIMAAGGAGGKGGNGGNAGNGKSGEETDKEIKLPGNGGNGGRGGAGGNGGIGGKVTCIVHPSADQIVPFINCNISGGIGGASGSGGKPGNGGTPLTGQIAGKNGLFGNGGTNGSNGFNGVCTFVHSEFDINLYK
jgi:hypothetical protein